MLTCFKQRRHPGGRSINDSEEIKSSDRNISLDFEQCSEKKNMLAFLWTTFLDIMVLESYLSQQSKVNWSDEVNGFVLRLCGAV